MPGIYWAGRCWGRAPNGVSRAPRASQVASRKRGALRADAGGAAAAQQPRAGLRAPGGEDREGRPRRFCGGVSYCFRKGRKGRDFWACGFCLEGNSLFGGEQTAFWQLLFGRQPLLVSEMFVCSSNNSGLSSKELSLRSGSGPDGAWLLGLPLLSYRMTLPFANSQTACNDLATRSTPVCLYFGAPFWSGQALILSLAKKCLMFTHTECKLLRQLV